MSYTQHFPRHAVKVVQTKMWSGDHALRKHMKLEVHRNAYEVHGHKVVSLEGHEVCLNTWSIIHSVSRADFYRFKGYSTHGMHTSHHGNRGTKKRRVATRQACASLAAMIEGVANLMPHKFRTLPSGERVIERILPSGTKWKDLQHHINEVLFLVMGHYIHFYVLK
jgi:ribosomal protein L34E